MDKTGRRKKLDSATEERSERLIEMKQTERKRDKTPAEPTEGGGRRFCQIWTEEQNKEGANHSRLQRKTYFSTPQILEWSVQAAGKGAGITTDGWMEDNRSNKSQERKQQRRQRHTTLQNLSALSPVLTLSTPLKFSQNLFGTPSQPTPPAAICLLVLSHLHSHSNLFCQ